MNATIKEELTKVQRLSDGKCNLIGEDGKILSDKWFEFADIFRDGLALVERINGESCKIDKNGKIIS